MGGFWGAASVCAPKSSDDACFGGLKRSAAVLAPLAVGEAGVDAGNDVDGCDPPKRSEPAAAPESVTAGITASVGGASGATVLSMTAASLSPSSTPFAAARSAPSAASRAAATSGGSYHDDSPVCWLNQYG